MQQDSINLNLNDLKNVVNVIDYAAAQGAFKGWDTIRQVMEVREKVAVFLQAAEAIEQKKAEAASAQPASELEISYEDSNDGEAEAEAKPKKRSAKK